VAQALSENGTLWDIMGKYGRQWILIVKQALDQDVVE
jgi:hypothetical protein